MWYVCMTQNIVIPKTSPIFLSLLCFYIIYIQRDEDTTTIQVSQQELVLIAILPSLDRKGPTRYEKEEEALTKAYYKYSGLFSEKVFPPRSSITNCKNSSL